MRSEIRENTSRKERWSVIHPLCPEDSVSMTALRSMVAGMKGKLAGVAARGPFDGIMEHVAVPEGVAFEADALAGYRGGGPSPSSRGRGRRSFICTGDGSTGEQP